MCANKLLLADLDREYSCAFAKVITSLNIGIEITTANLDDAIDFRAYDLILTGGIAEETLKSIIRSRHSFEYFIILSEDRTEDLVKQSQEGERFWKIYKYQNIDRIISDLDYIISTVTGRKKVYRNDMETSLIGFIGGSGGSGRTVLAVAASRELARHHNKKVLYLSFEEIPATELYFATSSGVRNIGDYLYFLLEKQNEAVCSHLDSFLCRDEYGVETFLPSEGRNDLCLLGQEDLERFIQTISDSRRYDHIILDLKNYLTEQTLQLVDLCRKLIVIQSNDPVSVFKTEKLIRIMEKEGVLEQKSDYILVTNRASIKVQVGSNEQDLQVNHQKNQSRILVDDEKDSFRWNCGRLEIDICRSFGLGIKKIAEEILVSKA